MNHSGFRKIVKKWDKRSTYHTSELNISRPADVTPSFDSVQLAQMSDSISQAISDLGHLLGEGNNNDSHGNTDELEQLEQIVELDSSAVSTTVATKAFDRLCTTGSDNIDIVDVLDRFDIDFGKIDSASLQTFLHKSATSGNLHCLRKCLQRGVQLSKLDSCGRTALHYAVLNNRVHCVKALCGEDLDLDDTINLLDHTKFSALDYAIQNGYENAASLLLQKGAVLDFHNSSLCLSINAGHESMCRMLLRLGSSTDLSDSDGLYPLHIACKNNDDHILKTLLSDDRLKQKVDQDDENGWKPIFHCAVIGAIGCLELLLEHNCLVDISDDKGWTPLAYAVWHGNERIAQILSPKTTKSISSREKPKSDVPLLCLPPPTIPIYGQNCIGRNSQIQIRFKSDKKGGVPINLYKPNLSRVRIVITLQKLSSQSRVLAHGASIAVTYPMIEEKQLFEFTLDSLDNCFIQFDIFPVFGRRLLGRAICPISQELQFRIENTDGFLPFTLPMLDEKLSIVGLLGFEALICRNSKDWHSTFNNTATAAEFYHDIMSDAGSKVNPSSEGYLVNADFFAKDLSSINAKIDKMLEHVKAILSKHPRKAIFISSAPSECVLLTLKQRDFPVLLNISQFSAAPGGSCLPIHESVKFCKRAGILGLIVDEEPFIIVPELLSVLKDEGVFVVLSQKDNEIRPELHVDGKMIDNTIQVLNTSVI